jgi:AraC family transcriptional activator FtrA
VQKNPANHHRRVALLIDDGFSPLEFAVACEVFGFDRTDEIGRPWYRLDICGAHPGPIRSALAFDVIPEHGLDDLRGADTIIVPPIEGERVIGEQVLGALRREHARGARLVSLCTGAFVLAAAGLLDGRPATTHWTSADRLAEIHPTIRVDRNVLYVDDGDILTSAGSAASMDLCLHVVRRDFGADVANQVARGLVVPPHRDGGQAQFVDEPVAPYAAADPFGDALAWAQQHLGEPITVEDLAHRAAMSPRSFARRFGATTGTTPHRWISRQRVLLAQRLLETTDLSIDEVSWHCGLGTATNLRLHFAKMLRSSPTAYRRAFKANRA